MITNIIQITSNYKVLEEYSGFVLIGAAVLLMAVVILFIYAMCKRQEVNQLKAAATGQKTDRKSHRARSTQKNRAHQIYNALKDFRKEVPNLRVDRPKLQSNGRHFIRTWFYGAWGENVTWVFIDTQAEDPDEVIAVYFTDTRLNEKTSIDGTKYVIRKMKKFIINHRDAIPLELVI